MCGKHFYRGTGPEVVGEEMIQERKVKQVLIVGNGEDYDEGKICKLADESDRIIACDGGYNLLHRLRIEPDTLIGDFDSVDKKIAVNKNVEILRYPPEKDFSDSELALQKAVSFGPERICFVAVTGFYWDHSLANVVNLFRYEKELENISVRIITRNSEIFPIVSKKKGRSYRFSNLKGRRFSFFILEPLKGLQMEGFQYTFLVEDLERYQYSLSNVISEEKAVISFLEGKIVGILFDENFV